MPDSKRYLGDGVYASDDGFQIQLDTDGNTIYLDHSVFFNLLKFGEKIFQVSITVKAEKES